MILVDVAVLSDTSKRFLYDVGAYDSDDDENVSNLASSHPICWIGNGISFQLLSTASREWEISWEKWQLWWARSSPILRFLALILRFLAFFNTFTPINNIKKNPLFWTSERCITSPHRHSVNVNGEEEEAERFLGPGGNEMVTKLVNFGLVSSIATKYVWLTAFSYRLEDSRIYLHHVLSSSSPKVGAVFWQLKPPNLSLPTDKDV